MRSCRGLSVAFAALCALAAPAAALAQTASRNAVVFEGDVGPTPSAVSELGSVSLRRFKKNRILRVEASLDVYALSSGEIALLDYVQLNGHSLPFQSAVCTNQICSVAASTFVDLDAFAASYPDESAGQPLVVTIYGRAEWSGTPFEHRLRMLVQLVPK